MSPGVLWASLLTIAAGVSTRDELFRKYSEIFPSQNRNAASHRWATYILERSAGMSPDTLRDLFAGFCPVSGSPLSYQRSELRVNMTLPLVGGGTKSGLVYYCCWPCICDTMDFIKVDTKTIGVADGSQKQFHFLVIGNPCKHQEAIPSRAPDVNCDADQNLVKATLSDHGHIIIGLFFEQGVTSGRSQGSFMSDYVPMCEERAATGYRSGMGEIFRQVAAISPVNTSLPQQSGISGKAEPEQLQAGTAGAAHNTNEGTSGGSQGDQPETSQGAQPAAEPQGASTASGLHGLHMSSLSFLVIGWLMHGGGRR